MKRWIGPGCVAVLAAILIAPGSAGSPSRSAATYGLSGKVLAVKRGAATTVFTLRLDSVTIGIGAGAKAVPSLAGYRRVRASADRTVQVNWIRRGRLVSVRAIRRGHLLTIQATAPPRATGRTLFRARLIVITSR